MRLMKRLLEVPPKDWGRKVQAKLGLRQTDIPEVEDILSSRKHMRPQRHYDFLSRYEAILSANCSWEPISFDGKRVIEMGSGPVLGWAAMGVFLGCEEYFCVDPYFNPKILEAPAYKDAYLLNVYKDLSALYSQRMTFEEFLSRMDERVVIVREVLLDSNLEGKFDLALSNSCFEHVFPLEETIVRLHELTAPGGRFIHLVDFGNHQGTKSPFEGLYTVTPEERFAKNGRLVNLARGKDVLRIFKEAGFEAVLVPYCPFPEYYNETPISYWTERYTAEELFLKTALIAGPVSG